MKYSESLHMSCEWINLFKSHIQYVGFCDYLQSSVFWKKKVYIRYIRLNWS